MKEQYKRNRKLNIDIDKNSKAAIGFKIEERHIISIDMVLFMLRILTISITHHGIH